MNSQNNQKIIDALGRGSYEIRQLRRENEVLRAKSAVVDAFAAALNARPPEGSMTVDVAWQMEKLAEQIQSMTEAHAEPKEATAITEGE